MATDRFDHLFIEPSSFDAALAFYRDGLGWAERFRWGAAGEPRGVGLDGGGTKLVLAERHAATDHSKSHGIHGTRPTLHLAVDDLAARHAELAAKGLALFAPETTHWGTRWFVVRDPDGNLIAFEEHGVPDRTAAPGTGGRRAPVPSLRVVPLAPADAPRYRDLMLQAYAVDADAFTSTPGERAAAPASWWARRIADPEGLGVGFGAFDGDALVGSVALEFSAKPKTRHKALLIGMFVAPSHRGAGAGRALLQAALAAARARPGVRVVTLTATQGNAAAIRLYESCGFRSFGVEPMAIRTPGGWRAKVHMALALEGAEDDA